MSLSSDDTRCRAYLESRRACLESQLDALRAEGLALWNRANAQLLAGRDPTPWERLACDLEARRRQIDAALTAIGRELDGMPA